MNEKIKELFLDCMADAFMLDKEYLASNLDLRLREDLAANSMKYFPLVGGLEEELDITLNFRDFQNECHTIRQGIAYVQAAYAKQKK